jgi:hypothetical protein
MVAISSVPSDRILSIILAKFTNVIVPLSTVVNLPG